MPNIIPDTVKFCDDEAVPAQALKAVKVPVAVIDGPGNNVVKLAGAPVPVVVK